MWLSADPWHLNIAEVVAWRKDDDTVILVLRTGDQIRLGCDTPEFATTLAAELTEALKDT